MTILIELLRDDAGKAPLSYAVIAIVLAIIGIATACSIDANLRPH
ncbi:MAG TPA: hypothetical protein VGR79_04125 [Stellaceae bacterium]|nr:hypothetical protein [Stellaceae bacterium]